MKKIMTSLQILLTAAFIFTMPMHSMNKKSDQLIKSLKTRGRLLQEKTTSVQAKSDIEEVYSPAIQKEANKNRDDILKAFVNDSRRLDAYINSLPASQRKDFIAQQLAVLEPIKPALKKIMAEEIQNNWRQNGKEIIQAAGNVAMAGMKAAAIGFVLQAATLGINNLTSLNSNELLISGLIAAANAAILELSKNRIESSGIKTLLASTGSNTLAESFINPSFRGDSFKVTMPSFTGPINSWIMAEGIAIAMQTAGDNMSNILNKANIKAIVLGGSSSPNNALATAILPQVHSVISNENIATALTNVGAIVFQSAVIGGLLYSTGLGYTTTMTESIGYAVVTGMAQGTISAISALTHKAQPGAILNILSAPIGQQAVNFLGAAALAATPERAAVALAQAAITEVSNLFISHKNAIAQAASQSISSRWGGTWNMVSSGWNSIAESIGEGIATLQEIEPLPIQ